MTPRLATNEIIARISPMNAYLRLKNADAPTANHAGRRLYVNAIYRHGIERSAQSAFAYHVGMTMAHWVCASMMGLGETFHIEGGGPNGDFRFQDPTLKLPDLWGTHSSAKQWWLIEAKARQGLGVGVLRDAMEQLNNGSSLLPNAAHTQVLCGTGLPNKSVWETDPLFLTVDTFDILGVNDPVLAAMDEDIIYSDDDALLRVAESQLLIFRALAFGAVDSIRITPLSADRSGRQRAATGFLTPLESDQATTRVRERQVAPGVEAIDFIVGKIQGIGVHLGMSVRLFAACNELHRAQANAAYAAVPELSRWRGINRSRPAYGDIDQIDDDAFVYQSFRNYFESALQQTRPSLRSAFEGEGGFTISDLLRGREFERSYASLGLLEGVTAETYIAIESNSPILL
ncbi:hypothetical protein SMD20_35075 [Nonomuraea sp. LP-02]|uniref:hypothetical protein n=1 Tax=Nonomuraea sp. LP-02 TaxID=3097960 RepID=UPI002E32773A|nr:hypothetical protein [Nonomuraea sp. LP-02]MED7929511.1 hypothetical protein [Nonomuraea sp. LP-02]